MTLQDIKVGKVKQIKSYICKRSGVFTIRFDEILSTRFQMIDYLNCRSSKIINVHKQHNKEMLSGVT